MDLPEAYLEAARQILVILEKEPEREFHTSEIAKETQLDAGFLVKIAPYFSPYARRGTPRPGYGTQLGKTIRPFVWIANTERN